MSSAQLVQALAILPRIKDDNLLVGMNTADDAGVYRLKDDLAVVYTIDLLTPVINDPYIYGQIVAANSISDIYAMGGDPHVALNVIGFPGNGDPEVLGMILKGGQEKAAEAEVTIVGGHTFVADEIKYGLSVLGYIHPDKIITNGGARPGDVLLLTKPIGVGILVQAVIAGKGDEVDIKPVVKAMTALNKEASIAMRESGAHAATDITGYGLAGHLVEMAEGSRTGIELSASALPIHDGALEVLKSGIEEPGIAMNVGSFKDRVDLDGVDPLIGKLIFSSETSGGLVIVMSEESLKRFRSIYKDQSPVIGRVKAEGIGKVKVVP